LNKRIIIQKIIAALALDLESYTSSAKTAFAAATDEQSKAENKYDTRALEASYLARGQSIQALEIMRAIQHYETMPVRDFIAKAPIDIGALVELSRNGESTFYFVGPHAGGTELDVEGECVLVITPGSPMAQQLMGKRCGDSLQIKVGRAVDRYEIATVL
jgi:transcription elongation GreA/GreB family factor